jgi:hypothetical protein
MTDSDGNPTIRNAVTTPPNPLLANATVTDLRAEDPSDIGALLDRYGACISASGLPEEILNTLDEAVSTTIADPPRPWRPQPAPTGMIDVFHHPAQWQMRQHPALVDRLREAVGTDDIWMSVDRLGSKAPSGDSGATSFFLHWDTEPSWAPAARQRGLRAVQGLLYLSDVSIDDGPFWCHLPFNDSDVRDDHLRRHPLVETPYGPLLEHFTEPLRLTGRRGDLVLWDYHVAHGSAPHTGTTPRRCAYVTARPAGDDDERLRLVRQVRSAAPPDWFPGPPDGERPFEDWTTLGRQVAGLASP